MNSERFRELALSLPETLACDDTNRPDFQVQGSTFASLFPGGAWAVVRITPELQTELYSNEPAVFEPCKGAWGRAGATIAVLENADEGSILRALIAAWHKAAPATLAENNDDQNL